MEDEDLEPFLKKCYDNLNEDGIIIVKENLYNLEGEGEEEEEEEDNYQFKYSELDYSK